MRHYDRTNTKRAAGRSHRSKDGGGLPALSRQIVLAMSVVLPGLAGLRGGLRTEAYIELMQALRAGRCIHNYEAWLFKVAILKGQVMIREEKMRREMQFENSSDKVIAMEQAGIYQQTFPSDTDPDPTDEEIRRRAVTVLSKLNDTDRRIYYEHYVRRKPLRQVAAELNMTENAVSKRHVRLKEKIKRSIQSLK